MIEHVYRRANMCSSLSNVYIATCDREIADAAEGFGAPVIMTSDAHERASDRVAEAARDIDTDIVVMLQGDEPTVHGEMIEQAVHALLENSNVVCSNLARPITDVTELRNPNIIKVVVDRNGDALYFSREPFPHTALLGVDEAVLFKQVCVIPFRKRFLLSYAELPPTPLERAESIDMLRILEHGYKVRMVPTNFDTRAVDVPDDVTAVEELMRNDPLVQQYA